MLVFHQCMEKEWKEGAWGRDSARDFARKGFAVVRVKSEHWEDLKRTKPEAFRFPYIQKQTQQEMICSIVMRDITCPMIQNVVQQMRIEALPLNMHEWSADWDVELPPGHGVCIPKLDVVAITEASSQLAAGVGPQVVRTLYRSYTQSFVWAGFNGKSRVTGSKLLLAEPDHFGFLKAF